MISMAKVKSASKAADYYTRDNFHTAAEGEQHSAWYGKGAEALGLSGSVTRDALQAVLEGRLPDGTDLAARGEHRPGFELVFSPPKSVSLLALVGGDERLIAAHREAVRETLAWAESNLVQTRITVAGSTVRVKTNALIVALFDHDANRNLEPDLHTHALIANATQGADGKWRTLVNDRIWQRNTLLGSIYNARMRRKVQALGYQTTPQGKHGAYEITTIGRETIETYSTRSQAINAAHRELDHQTPQTRDAVALKTRQHKAGTVDRAQRMEHWQAQARDIGIDFGALVEMARKAASPDRNPWARITQSLARLGTRAHTFLEHVLGLVQGRVDDPLVPETPGSMTPDRLAAAHALASAVRHLSEREAAFQTEDLLKAALDLHLPIDEADIERRIAELKADGLLIESSRRHAGLLTTPEAMDAEQRILEIARDGLGRSSPVLPLRDAVSQVAAAARAASGHTLNPGQQQVAGLILASSDRYVAVQGVAGAGKTEMLKSVARVLRDQGHRVLGLGHQNRLVRMLEADTGIPSRTIRSFLAEHRDVLEGKLLPDGLAARQEAFRGVFLLVDEASMVSSNDKLKLMQIADALGVQRVALVGDKKQLGAIEAGKPFEVMQSARLPTAQMNQNLRQRTPALRAAAQAAQEGRIQNAMIMLHPMMQEARDPASAAAEAWLALPPDERARTALYASGRKVREDLNRLVQRGLLDGGVLKGSGMDLAVLDRLAITREEERHAHVYRPGLKVEFTRSLPTAGIRRGASGTIRSVDPGSGKVTVLTEAGEIRSFFPQKLAPNRTRETVRLYAAKTIRLYEGDQIRWTDNDKNRGLFNADLARVVRINDGGVLVRTSGGQEQLLTPSDPMLKRMDLAYALNAHMAQGLTSDRAIAVMLSHERNLSNQRLFLVTITRVRHHLTFVTDSINKLARQIAITPGDKTSALEVTGKIQPIIPPAPARQAPSVGPAEPGRVPSLDLG